MEIKARVLGLDYGERRIGVAISDGLGLTAQPLEVMVNKAGQIIPRLADLIAERQISQVVMGLPKHLNNAEGVKAQEARAFGQALAQTTGVVVDFMDERLSTVAAHRLLMESGLSGPQKRQVVDKLAAAIILQTWLDAQRHQQDKAER